MVLAGDTLSDLLEVCNGMIVSIQALGIKP